MERAIDDRSCADRRRKGEASAHVALTTAENRGVDGQDECFVVRRGRTLDHLLDQAAIPPGVHLKPESPVAHATNLLDRAGAERRQRVRETGAGGRPGYGELTGGVSDAGEASRREDERVRGGLPQDRRRDVDAMDVAEDAGSEARGRQRGLVGGECALVFCSTVDVV